MRSLTEELKQIHNRDDLLTHAQSLQYHFNALVDVMIRAQNFKDTHPGVEVDVSKKDHAISDQLRIELNRVLNMEGGREVIEKAQEESLNRLDAFERTLPRKKALKFSAHLG